VGRGEGRRVRWRAGGARDGVRCVENGGVLGYSGGMEKDFDEWNSIKKGIDAMSRRVFAHPREVWWCALGVNVGVEVDGKHGNFERPVLIVRVYNKHSMLVLPITTKEKRDGFHTAVRLVVRNAGTGAEVTRDVYVKLTQARVISTQRLLRKVDMLEKSMFEKVLAAFRAHCNHRHPGGCRGVSEAEAIIHILYIASYACQWAICSTQAMKRKKVSTNYFHNGGITCFPPLRAGSRENPECAHSILFASMQSSEMCTSTTSNCRRRTSTVWVMEKEKCGRGDVRSLGRRRI